MPRSDAALADRAPAPAPPGALSGIVWLASYPKSGNTWTRAFLHNLFALMQGDDADGDAGQDINAINEFTTWDLAAKRYEPHLGKPILQATREEIAATRPQIQAEIAAETPGLALVKTHHALVLDRGHPTLNFAVTSGAVYLVRNPLDVAVSFAHHMGAGIDDAIDQMGRAGLETDVTDNSVYEVYGSWSEHVASWTARPHRAVCVLRYEDLLDEPFGTFSKLARHLLMRPTPDQMDQAIARSSFERLRAQEDANGFREKPDRAERFFRQGKAGEWRTALSRRQVRRIVEAHGEQMRRFGYLGDDIAHLAR